MRYALRGLRMKAGLTQREFGKLLNMSDTSVSAWESGKVDMLKTAKKIVDALSDVLGEKVTFEDVFFSEKDAEYAEVYPVFKRKSPKEVVKC